MTQPAAADDDAPSAAPRTAAGAAAASASTARGASGGVPLLDRSSLSNPHEAVTTHLTWTAEVDFGASTVRGTASYDVEILSPDATSIRLDTSGDLSVGDVTVGGAKSSWSLSEADTARPHLGRCLVIPLPDGGLPAHSVVRVVVSYETSPDGCSALQWLPPKQTAGGTRPYLFSQCQAIHARSLVPCMDCPGVKMTYEASITVPSWATCVMSALARGSSTSDPEHTTYNFVQPVPIPSYLLAIVVGDLASIDISPRCKVWSEPSVVEAAAFEFAQTEEFLSVAESLTLEYQWGRYDLLCLPPSFPYGGMENPCLTFVTPTLLAGDRSLADVVAHEISHSWTGNLVTNATWEHFWLNEGWTMWLQRKIMARIKKDKRVFDFDAIGGWKHLSDDVELMPDDYTKLIPALADNDPDDAFSSVPYEKGFNLLYALERRVGTPAFEEFAKAYLNKFKFLTVTSDEFRSFFESHFKDKQEAIKDFDWVTWFNGTGMPLETPDFDRTLSKAAEELAGAWITFDDSTGNSIVSPPSTNISDWSSNQTVCFLDTFLSLCEEKSRPLKVGTVKSMSDKYGMGESKNSEILFRYCNLAISAGDPDILPTAVRFITSQGRMKYVRPLYRALFESKMGKELAVDTFLANESFYHPIAAKMIAKDLKVAGDTKSNNDPVTKSRGTPEKRGVSLYLVAGLAAAAVVGLIFLRRKR